MVTSKETILKIREIINKHYNRLVLSTLGFNQLSEKELKELEDAGYDVSNKDSLLSIAYNHNFINTPIDDISPKSVGEMKSQQSVKGLKPAGQANDYAVESLNDSTKQWIEKLKLDVATRVETVIRQNNDVYRLDALKDLNRTDFADELMKESTLGKVKQKLQDTSKDANRDWLRVALTEVSNAVGIGSVDRIVTENKDKPSSEVFVFRITVKDAKTCKWCKLFYNDTSGPALYKLETLLDNGSNYGKKPDEWQPVVGSTHPNTRTSQVLELKPGFKLNPDGSVTYMGLAGWKDYVFERLKG